MAQLDAQPYSFASEDFDDQMQELRQLQHASDTLPPGSIVGGLLQFPVADGCAHYLVKHDEPLVLQHVPFADAYAIPAPYVRGLEREDIVAELGRRRRFNALPR